MLYFFVMLCNHCCCSFDPRGEAAALNFCATCEAAAAAELVAAKARGEKEVTCYNCKKTFKLATVADHAGFCGRCSKTQARSVEDGKAAIDHQLARVVWLHYYGIDSGIKQRCYCCGVQEISVFSFQCGHVIAQACSGPTTVSNLRPICAPCNQGMGTENMKEFAARNGFLSRLNGEAAIVSPELLVGAPGSRAPFVFVEARPGEDAANGCASSCVVM